MMDLDWKDWVLRLEMSLFVSETPMLTIEMLDLTRRGRR